MIMVSSVRENTEVNQQNHELNDPQQFTVREKTSKGWRDHKQLNYLGVFSQKQYFICV